MATCNRLIIEIPGDVSYSWGERPACCPWKVGPGAAFRQQEHPYTVKGNTARAAGTARLYLPRTRCRPRRAGRLQPVRDMSIRVFVTGGTFDKKYDELRGTLYFQETHLPEMLRLGRSRVDVSVRTLMMVDSLDMTEQDRDLVVEQCRRADESRIVITHGTDTMVETARALANGVTGKTVVLTGAMVPYAFGSSDGLFNLGSALSYVQTLPHGVYIAMNGRCFAWDNVRKNRDAGVFEPLRPDG
jgi:L-asparaginase